MAERRRRLPGPAVPSRPQFQAAGRHLRGGRRRGARGAVFAGLFRVRRDRARRPAAGRSGLCRLSGHGRGARRRPTGWRFWAPPIFAARASSTSTASRPARWRSTPPSPGPRSFRASPSSGSSRRRRRQRSDRHLCADGRSEPDRRVPHGLPQRWPGGDGRPGGAVRAQGHRAHGHRPDDQHVLVRRERSPLGRRLAPRDPRQRRALDLERCRRAAVAAAAQSVDRAHQLLRRQQSQGLRPAAARPRIPQLRGRRRVLRPPAERLGRAGRGLGTGCRAAGRDPDRRRDPRQHRGLLGAGPAGHRRLGMVVRLPPVLGRSGAVPARAGGAGDPHPDRQRRHPGSAAPRQHPQVRDRLRGRPAGEAGKAGRGDAGRDHHARHHRQRLCVADRRHQALAGVLRSPGRGRRSRQSALLPALRRLSAERNLALRVYCLPFKARVAARQRVGSERERER